MNDVRRVLARVGLCLSLCLFAAGAPAAETAAVATDSGKMVLATTWPMYELVRELASGTRLQITLLNSAELGCPHHYSLSPSDLLKVQQGGAVVAVGAGYEPYLDRIRAAAPQVRIVEVASGMPLMPAVDPDLEPYGNPHLFTSPGGMRVMVPVAGAFLSEFAENERDMIAVNQMNVMSQLGQIEAQYREVRRKVESVPVIVTHDSLDYVAGDLGLVVVDRLDEGENEGPAVSHLLAIKQAIRQKKIRAILVDSHHASKVAAMIARETGVPLIELDMLTTGPVDGSSLYKRMMATAEVLETALGTFRDE